MVSSKYGPSRGSGLSKRARGRRRPLGDDAFEGELAAGEEFLHLNEAVLGAMVVGDFG